MKIADHGGEGFIVGRVQVVEHGFGQAGPPYRGGPGIARATWPSAEPLSSQIRCPDRVARAGVSCFYALHRGEISEANPWKESSPQILTGCMI